MNRSKQIAWGVVLAGAVGLFLFLWRNPTNLMRRHISGANSVVITSGAVVAKSLGLDKPLCRTVSTEDEKEELVRALRCKSQFLPLGGHCMCSGYPFIQTFKDGSPSLTISLHHGRSIRTDKSGVNFPLTAESQVALAEYLTVHGFPSDAEVHSQIERRIRASNPRIEPDAAGDSNGREE